MTGFNRRQVLMGATALGTLPLLSRAGYANDTVKIGFMAPLSGFQQIVGEQVLAGAEIARDHINAAGGINGKPIELIIRDDRADANQAAALMREFGSSGINITMGTPFTAQAMAAAAIAPSLNGVHMISGAIDPRFSHDLYNPHIFMATQNSIQRVKASAMVLAEKYPDIKIWGSKMPDIAVAHDTWHLFVPAMQEAYKAMHNTDLTIIDPVLSKFGNADFKVQIVQLMSLPIEGLFGMEVGSDGVTFYKQARQLGLWNKVKVLSEHSMEITMGKTLGAETPPDAWCPTHWNPNAFKDVALSNHLVDEYTRRTGDLFPGGNAGAADTGLRALAAGIAAANSTETAAVIAALETVEFECVNGKAHFRKEDHQIVNAVPIVQVKPSDTEPGWHVTDAARYDGGELLPAPTPGEALTFR